MAGAQKTSQFDPTTSVTATDEVPILQGGQLKRIQVGDLVGVPNVGWIASGETWTYLSWTSGTSTGTLTVPTGATSKYAPGMVIEFTQSTGGTKHAVITAVTSTVLTIRMLDGTLNNETLSGTFYSTSNPLGAGLKPSESLKATVAFKAVPTQSMADNATTTISSYTENFDEGGNFASGIFTAPYNGVYHFDAVFKVDNLLSSGTYARVELAINVNGSAVCYGHGSSATGTFDPAATCGVTVKLTAGDQVRISVYQQSGSSKTPASDSSSFSGHLVGRT